MMHDTPRTVPARLAAVAVAAAVAMLGPALAQAGQVRLHDVVGVEGPTVTLGDIAELEGPAAKPLVATVVTRFENDAKSILVSESDVRRAMDEAGVNWALVSVSGFGRCTVKRVSARTAGVAADEAEPAAVASNLRAEVSLDTAMTLRAIVERRLVALAGCDAEDLRIVFDEDDAARLAVSAVVDRFEVTPRSTTGLGRVPVEVVRYERGVPADRFTVSAEVSRRYDALVTTREIDRGDRVTRDAVASREVWLDRTPSTPLDDVELVTGKVAVSRLPVGTPVLADHVRVETLVRRGELVTVRAIAGAVVVRTVARATEDGGKGELIKLRNERSRDTFTAVVTGRRSCVIQVDAAATADAAEPALHLRKGSS